MLDADERAVTAHSGDSSSLADVVLPSGRDNPGGLVSLCVKDGQHPTTGHVENDAPCSLPESDGFVAIMPTLKLPFSHCMLLALWGY